MTLFNVFIRNLKNFIRLILCLPVYKTRVQINDVNIIDNNEPLVPIIETEKLKINKDPKTPLRRSSFPTMVDQKVRKAVYENLLKASQNLPAGYKLFIFESFRPREVQLERFDFKLKQLQKEFPNLEISEIERLARLGVADPRKSFGPHQTGGAVDVTILNENNAPLNMGTDWAEFNKKTPTKNWHKIIFNKDGFKIMRNRKLLVQTMASAGFVNYPGEWWHYSYGDQAWAIYSGHKNAIYGEVKI